MQVKSGWPKQWHVIAMSSFVVSATLWVTSSSPHFFSSTEKRKQPARNHTASHISAQRLERAEHTIGRERLTLKRLEMRLLSSLCTVSGVLREFVSESRDFRCRTKQEPSLCKLLICPKQLHGSLENPRTSSAQYWREEQIIATTAGPASLPRPDPGVAAVCSHLSSFWPSPDQESLVCQ